MAVAVVKGQKVDITKTNPGLTQLKVAIGWQSSSAVEVDTSAFLLGENGMTSGDEDLIFIISLPTALSVMRMDKHLIRSNL